MQDELEKRIIDGDDDIQAFSVLADYLIEQGDPRGEFIQVQLALEDANLAQEKRQRLEIRESTLLTEHQRGWLGSLAPVLLEDQKTWTSPDYAFRRGYLHSLILRDLTEDLVATLVSGSEARFIQKLSLFHCLDDDNLIWSLGEASWPAMRGFEFGDGSGSINEGGAAASFIANMPRIETLSVSGRSVDTHFFSMSMPHLRTLSVSCAHDFQVDKLAENSSLDRLEVIELFPHALEFGESSEGYLGLEHVRTLVGSPHLPSLQRLELFMSTAGDAGCRAIVDSGILVRLRELNLTFGEVTDEGAAILAGSPDIGHLRKLVLNGNSLTEQGIQTLRSCGIAEVIAQDQRKWGEDREYLGYGDCE